MRAFVESFGATFPISFLLQTPADRRRTYSGNVTALVGGACSGSGKLLITVAALAAGSSIAFLLVRLMAAPGRQFVKPAVIDKYLMAH